MGWNMSNILVNEAIANKNAGGSDPVIAAKVEALEKANVYSATEVLIGKWGNDDLYRKVINDTFNINSATNYDLKLPEGAVVKRWSAYYLVNGNPVNLPYYNTSSAYCVPYIDASTNSFKMLGASSANNANVTIIVEYTKTVVPTKKGGKK